MIINHNITALSTYRQFNKAGNAQSKAMEKLSSGLRINKAGDDAAGLSISEKMRGQIRGLIQAERNAQDGISLLQTAEGALNETHSLLQRMRELATQAANDTNNIADKNEIQNEINQLTSEINRIAVTTEFNNQSILDGGQGYETPVNVRTLTIGLSETDAKKASNTAISGLVNGKTKLTNPYKQAVQGKIGKGSASIMTAGDSDTKIETIKKNDLLNNYIIKFTVPNNNDPFSGNITGTTINVSWGLHNPPTSFEDLTDKINGVLANYNIDNSIKLFSKYSTPKFSQSQFHNEAIGINGGVNSSDEQKAVSTFVLEKNLLNGDSIKIGSNTYKAVNSGTGAKEFIVGTNKEETAVNLAKIITNDADSLYNAKVSGNGEIILTQKVGSNLNQTVDVSAEIVTKAGKYEFSLTAMDKGSTITINDIKLELTKGGTAEETAKEVKSLIKANDSLNSKYSVELDGSKVILKEKPGKESSNPPSVITKTPPGSGYLANLQIGSNKGQSLMININDVRARALKISGDQNDEVNITKLDGSKIAASYTPSDNVTNGINNQVVEAGLDITTHINATNAISLIDHAINTVSTERSRLGAFQNRLEHTINNLNTSSENLSAAESRIRDVDIAKEMMDQTKSSILAQASQAMLAQANQLPQGVLQLLR